MRNLLAAGGVSKLGGAMKDGLHYVFGHRSMRLGPVKSAADRSGLLMLQAAAGL